MTKIVFLLLPSMISAMIALPGQIPYWAGGASTVSPFGNSLVETNQQLSNLGFLGLGGLSGLQGLSILQGLGSLQGFGGLQGLGGLQSLGFGGLQGLGGLQVIQIPLDSNTSPCIPCMICLPTQQQIAPRSMFIFRII